MCLEVDLKTWMKLFVNTIDKVAVCSRSFSKNQALREELLKRYEKVSFNDLGVQLGGQELVKFLKGHDKAIIALERVDENLLASLPELKVIGKYGVGLDMIDLESMRRHGVRLGWTGGVNRRSVSELAVAFSISLLRSLKKAHADILNGSWQQIIGGQLTGRKFGIVGCGNVGKDLVKLLQPFECEIYINDIRSYDDFYAKYSVKPVGLDELLSTSDIVSLHIPLNENTRNIISADKLSLMKSSSILINLARGGLVDEVALKDKLMQGMLAGAAFDVFAQEPPEDIELISLPNFYATPHIGGSSKEAILAMGIAAINGLDENVLL